MNEWRENKSVCLQAIYQEPGRYPMGSSILPNIKPIQNIRSIIIASYRKILQLYKRMLPRYLQ